jgi:hypothetical protein
VVMLVVMVPAFTATPGIAVELLDPFAVMTERAVVMPDVEHVLRPGQQWPAGRVADTTRHRPRLPRSRVHRPLPCARPSGTGRRIQPETEPSEQHLRDRR